MELEVTQAFPTVIGQFRVPDAESMNQDLRALILADEGSYMSLGRSNIGGWHSRPDFLNRSEPAVSALTTWVTWVVRQMIYTTAGLGAFKGTLSFSAWVSISEMVLTMHHTLTRTARGLACITWIPGR